MKKLSVLGMAGLCVALAFSSCKSSESAYKKAYEKAKQQEQAEPQQAAAPVEQAAPVVAAPVETKVVESAPVGVRQEKVTLVSGNGLKDFSVVCGSFGVRANADNLKSSLEGQGYTALVVFNAEANNGSGMYRVIVGTYDTHAEAASARDAFKAKYSSRADFQGSWLLYSIR